MSFYRIGPAKVAGVSLPPDLFAIPAMRVSQRFRIDQNPEIMLHVDSSNRQYNLYLVESKQFAKTLQNLVKNLM